MRRIDVVDYRPEWPNEYRHEEGRLTSTLGECLVAVHHIGSTSVPGLAAKPVIDILLEVRDLEELDTYDSAMARLGYEVMGEFGIERRRFYRKGGDQRTHHVHAFPAGDEHVTRHLAFRDYLIAHPEVADEYDRLKRKIADEYRTDSDGYCGAKNDFVVHHEYLALAWFSNRTHTL
ncbi:GrpB family protein [Saccharospirillum salsuginis]|uniref:GrpB family protein n=1 Tax=Saccharospirillum salsuginis TaxID=418750 RepID=A0A918N625_9GAMM|nr:GrpB family protein [Saccharospirillum salsuginis]GGX41155.1 hypothetical protein GCM10007392_05000 [Saccharospirillum salsuginis]